MNKKQERVKYTKEFKQDAVNLVTKQGYSANEVARRLGVGQSVIAGEKIPRNGRWRSTHRWSA